MANNNKVKTTRGTKIAISRKQNKILSNMSIEEVLEMETYGTNVGNGVCLNKGGYLVNKNGYSPLEELMYN
jgi:hypothetical protein